MAGRRSTAGARSGLRRRPRPRCGGDRPRPVGAPRPLNWSASSSTPAPPQARLAVAEQRINDGDGRDVDPGSLLRRRGRQPALPGQLADSRGGSSRLGGGPTRTSRPSSSCGRCSWPDQTAGGGARPAAVGARHPRHRRDPRRRPAPAAVTGLWWAGSRCSTPASTSACVVLQRGGPGSGGPLARAGDGPAEDAPPASKARRGRRSSPMPPACRVTRSRGRPPG